MGSRTVHLRPQHLHHDTYTVTPTPVTPTAAAVTPTVDDTYAHDTYYMLTNVSMLINANKC